MHFVLLLFGFCYGLVTFAEGVSSSSVQTQSQETISSIVKHLYYNNNQILEQHHKIYAEKYVVKSSYSELFPTIDASYSNSRNVYNEPFFDYGVFNAPEYLKNEKYKLELRQNIFNGFRDINRIRKEKARLVEVVFGAVVTEQDVILSGLLQYLSTAKYTETSQILKESVGTYQKQKEGISQRFNVKDITKTDLLQTQISIETANIQYEQSLQSLQQAKNTLERFLGKRVEVKENISKIVQEIDFKEKTMPCLVEDVEKTIDSHPRYIYEKAGKLQAEIQRDIVAGNFMPRVDASLFTEKNTLDNSLYGYRQTNRGGSLNVTVPLFHSGRNYYDYSSAEETMKANKLALKDFRYKIKGDILNAIMQFRTNQDLLKNNQKAFDVAKEMRENALQEFKFGLKDNFQVIFFTKTLYDRKTELITAQYSLVSSYYQLLNACGALTEEEFGIKNASIAGQKEFLKIIRNQLEESK